MTSTNSLTLLSPGNHFRILVAEVQSGTDFFHLTSDPESGSRSIPHGSRKKSASRGHLAEANLRKKLNAAADAGGPDMVTGFFQMANDFMANRIEEFPDPALNSMTLPPKSELSHPLPLTPEPLPSSPERRIRLTIRRINGQFVIGV